MGQLKVLMVAEKPSLAKSIAEHLSRGKVGWVESGDDAATA